MNESNPTKRPMILFGLALVLLSLPACHGAGPRADESSRVAYRPVPTSLSGRPFYVSGYGGADYSPARPRNIPAMDGTSAYVTPAPVANPPAVTIRQGTWDEP